MVPDVAVVRAPFADPDTHVTVPDAKVTVTFVLVVDPVTKVASYVNVCPLRSVNVEFESSRLEIGPLVGNALASACAVAMKTRELSKTAMAMEMPDADLRNAEGKSR